MNKLTITLGIVLSNFGVFGQTNYEITEVGNSYSQTQIESALNDADMCGFHYSNSNRELVFDDGSIVLLKSAQQAQGMAADCFIQPNEAHQNEVWQIASSGHLVRRISIKQGK